jgi:Histone chaperone Rttp106-like/Structure-specific recognition protein (SSRP1)
MNTNLAGKNEVAVELSLHDSRHENGVNGAENGEAGEDGEKKAPRPRGHKASTGTDQLVEMRFYVPGGAQKDEEAEDEEQEEDEEAPNGAKVEDNAASRFYTTLLDKAEIGDVAGPTIASFLEVLHLTPRGRFDVDMYESSLRLRGKTYDYKIEYESIKKFMLLPKPDEVHMIICMGLDPPLRQGQTRYPFLVMQFKRDEEVQLDLNMTDEQLNDEKYRGKLQRHYEAPAANVLSAVYRGLAGRKVIMPAKDFSSVHRQAAVKCSIKANEGHLYCLDKSFLFVPKPATYIAFDTIAAITFSRVGGALAASRTFDVTIKLKEGRGEHQFSNVNREEQGSLEDFLKLKGIKVKNEMMEDVRSGPSSYASSFIFSLPLNFADQFSSTVHYSRKRSKTNRKVMMRLLEPIVAQQTKMKRARTMISKKTVTRMLQKSLTANMPVAVPAMTMPKPKMMPIWTWTRKMSLSWWSDQRRKQRNSRNGLDHQCFPDMVSFNDLDLAEKENGERETKFNLRSLSR